MSWRNVVLMVGTLALATRAEAASEAAQDTEVFHYRPANGAREVETRVAIRDADFGPYGKRLDRQETRTAFSYRKEKSGWAVTTKMLSSSFVRDGQRITDPMSEAVLGRTLVYPVRPDGSL